MQTFEQGLPLLTRDLVNFLVNSLFEPIGQNKELVIYKSISIQKTSR